MQRDAHFQYAVINALATYVWKCFFGFGVSRDRIFHLIHCQIAGDNQRPFHSVPFIYQHEDVFKRIFAFAFRAEVVKHYKRRVPNALHCRALIPSGVQNEGQGSRENGYRLFPVNQRVANAMSRVGFPRADISPQEKADIHPLRLIPSLRITLTLPDFGRHAGVFKAAIRRYAAALPELIGVLHGFLRGFSVAFLAPASTDTRPLFRFPENALDKLFGRVAFPTV